MKVYRGKRNIILTLTNCFSYFSEKRESLLQHGKLDVVKALNDLPKTKHLASSFVVDVSQATVSTQQLQTCKQNLLFSHRWLCSRCGVCLRRWATRLR